MTSATSALLSSLAQTDKRLRRLSKELEGHPAVERVDHAIMVHEYRTGDRVEWYVDAALGSGNTVGLWLELGWLRGAWTIESSIRHNHAAGEDELIHLPTRETDDATLATELAAAAEAACTAMAGLDLSIL